MDSQNLLDEMVNGDSVQILKAALPYLPSSGQSVVSDLPSFWNCRTPYIFSILPKETWKSVPDRKATR